ncbi:MAG: IS66 family insertion sequence element accessory protein TnpB [Polyangia bacterium]
MIRLGPGTRAFAYGAPVDMRKGFEGLLALAQRGGAQPLCTGDLFLFVGRDRRRAKVLYFDGTGLCLLHKRLEQGRFACLWREAPEAPLQLSVTELHLFLEGCALVGQRPLSPPALTPSALTPSRSGSPPNNRT